ncbi:MAG: Na/Pi cotransporter family protein, partial [Proteobacteria bacterium]|nr:Na/Pi cotransporter family protein [Pseudomonadota bacterium]
AWMMHSSVAAVLLFVTLAAQDLLPISGGIAMTLGANFGGAALAFTLTLGAELTARRVIVANVIMRGGSALIVLLAFVLLTPPLEVIGASPARQILNFHLVFNLVLALISLPLVGPILRVASTWVRKPHGNATLERVSALDPSMIATPDRALACGTREILMMGEIVASMMRSVIGLYGKWNDETAAAIQSQEAEFNRMHLGLKLFLAKVQQAANDEDVDRRAHEQAEMATNLSGACHAIADPLVSFARRLDQTGNRFSTTGMDEIRDFHDRVLANVQIALTVLMTYNPEEARLLVEEKDRLRDYEQQLQRSHLDRIRSGLRESIETSAVHQETLRTIKQINSSFSMLAYPILDKQGLLMASRLNAI